MSKENRSLGKTNIIICVVAVLLIIVGFILMSGPSSTNAAFQPYIFSFRRIRIAPVVCLSGFILMIVGILYSNKKVKDND